MKSTDYHDYVLKNGKLIGDFEGMYKFSSELPWHQDTTAYWINANILLELISSFQPYESICEIGCGLGYFSDRLQNKLVNSKITGYDISSTAIIKARERFPKITFEQMDITKESRKQFDCVICKEIMWYIFPHLNQVLINLNKMLPDNGILCISQYFPSNPDYVGHEVIKNSEHLRDIFQKDYELLYFGKHFSKETKFEEVVDIIYSKK
jgi:2-polyprenyl-3-methyl-5-hydroxy-6-metoxy-1,4-benzoquinol methylase